MTGYVWRDPARYKPPRHAPVPPEAVTAAAVAIHDIDCPDRHCSGSALAHAHSLAKAALEAAAPLIRAGERDRIRPALEDALDGLQEMIGYVPEYFQRKWDHQGYIDRAVKALADLLREDPP